MSNKTLKLTKIVDSLFLNMLQFQRDTLSDKDKVEKKFTRKKYST